MRRPAAALRPLPVAPLGVPAAVILVTALGCGGAPPPVEAPPLERLRVEIEEVGFTDSEREVVRENVAESVASRVRVDHISMPEPVVGGGPDPDQWPRVTVMNETNHGLVVWISGPCARTVALPPHSRNAVEVCEGVYQLAGQVAVGNFLPLVGENESLENGYQYTFSFYVQSNPYQTRRRRR